MNAPTDECTARAKVRRAMTRAVFVGLALAWSMPAANADELITQFLAANPPLEDTVCAYTTTASSSEYPGDTRVERFSPSTGWRLLAVNGEPPSEQAREDYAADASDRSRQRQQPADLDLAKMMRPDTARIVEETGEQIVFEFTPRSPEGGRGSAMMEKMSGRLTVAKDSLRPLRYVAELGEPASPMPTMKIEEFQQEMTFDVEPTTGASLMASMTFRMRGKAFVFRKIDSEAHIVVSDYDCRPDTTTE